MPQVNQVQNLLLGQAPPNVRAQLEAGQEAQQRAAAPSAPYTSRMAGLARALEGGLGGFMEGSAIHQAMQGRQDAAKVGYGLLNSLQPGGAGAPGVPSATPMGQGGIGSDHVAALGPGDYLGRLGQIESGNRDGISNKASGATGRYQFIASTWDRLSKQYPELGLTPDGRTDPAQQQRAIQAFTNENASTLGRAGFQATPGNLYLAHFAGAGGATAALRADPSTPVEQIMGARAVAANPFLKGKTAGDLVAWANGKMAGVDPSTVSGAPPSSSPATGTAVASASPVHPAAPLAASSAPIGDAAALAAQNRLTSGKGTDADRALLTTYRQQQNTPATPRTAAADITSGASAGTLAGGQGADTLGAPPASDGTVRGDLMAAVAQHGGLDPDAPAPNATPTGMQGLPPGVTPAMWAASQGPGADLHRKDEVPAGMPPYVPGAGPQGPNLPAGAGTVTASGVPHQLAPGASARADSGVAASVSSGPSDTASGVLQPQLDPEGTAAQDRDPNAEPSLRDTLEAAFKGPDLGKAQPAVVPDPTPLGPGDQVGPSGLVAQPAGPSSLPSPGSGLGGAAGAQPNPVAPAPLAPGDNVGADGTVTPASDGSVRGDLLAAAAQHGMNVSGAPVVPPPQGDLTAPPPAPAPDPVAAGQMAGRDVALDPVVPDPQGAAVPPAPSSPNDALQGPQSDAAAGNGGDDLRAMLTAQVMGSGAGTTGPQSDAAMGGGALGDADGPAAPQAGSPTGLPDTAPLPPPGAQTLQAATDATSAAAPTIDPNAVGLPATEPTLRDHLEAAFNGMPPPGGASTPGPGAAPSRMAGADVGDAGLDGMRAGMVSQQPGVAPVSGGAPSTPSTGSTALAAMAGPGVPPPSPMPGQGGPSSSDLSKMAVGPLTPSYMSGLASALSTPAQPAAAPHPMALANALDGSKPAPGATPTGPAPMPPTAAPMPSMPSFGGSGTNAPAGNSPSADPSSPQNFMRSEMARAQGGAPQASGLIPSIQSLFSPGSTTAGGSAQSPQQGTPDQARAIAQQTQANPSASPAAQSMAGQVMAATSGQGGGEQANEGGAAPGYTSPAMAPAPSGAPAAPAAAGAGGWTPEQRQSAMNLLSGPQAAYLPAELREALTAKLFPQPQKLSQGEGLVGLRSDGTYGSLYTQPGMDKFAYSPDGVHVLNKTTGQVTMPGADGSGGAGGWRPMTPTEMQRYGVTDGRPAYIAPNGEPHFGMPGTQGQGETEEAKESGKAAAGRQDTMLNAANAAPMKIARLDLIGQVLDKTQTGPLAGEMGTAAAIASRIGVAPERLAALGIDPNQAVNNAIANKLAGEMTMSSIGAKNGGMPASNFSVAERQFIEALYPNIENMPGANRMVIDVLKTAEQRNAQIASEWADYKDQQRGAGKALSYGDFEDSFRRAHAQDNIFAPIIQRYQAGGYTPAAPSPGGMPSAAPAGGGQGGAPPMGQPGSAASQMPGQGGQGTPPRNVAPGVTGSPPQPQGGQPPVTGARQAPDGNWYVSDPNRPGKYLKVQG